MSDPETPETHENEGADAPVVFVADASAEADRVADALRARGFQVVDVPLTLLSARVAVHTPALILLDADAPDAPEQLARLRDVPGAQTIDVLLTYAPGGVGAARAESLRHEASGSFARPIDAVAIVRKAEALVGAPDVPPPSRRPSRPSQPARSTRPPALSRPSMPPPIEVRDAYRASGFPPPRLPHTTLSPAVEAVLRQAEEQLARRPPSDLPSPEEEVEAVLPAEVLAALDEPLEAMDEPDADADAIGATPLAPAARTPTPRPITAPPATLGRRDLTTSAPPAPKRYSLEPDEAEEVASAPPTVHERASTAASQRDAERGTDAAVETPRARGGTSTSTTAEASPASVASTAPPPSRSVRPVEERPPRPPEVPTPRPATPPPAPEAYAEPEPEPEPEPDAHDRTVRPRRPDRPVLPEVLRPGDALAALATCIAGRATGALCLEGARGIRRLVLREGDLVTAASGLDDESLLAFLTRRGDLARTTADRLRGKIPAFGRHAGAALVAHGHLGQDQLWPMLRAHAEWVVACALSDGGGTCSFEDELPDRLRAEPSVFGGATGAEILVETARRVVAADEAVARLGGPGARIQLGPRSDLLSECALADAEASRVRGADGARVGDLSAEAPELGPVLVALAALGVVVTRAASAPARDDGEAPAAGQHDVLDVDALRARVKARLALVEEGDYFALLGVTRAATGYEIRRAYLDLRRAFEPSRVLTAATIDLADDLRLIVEVLDEAHDILRDDARRERYRRAIDAPPPI